MDRPEVVDLRPYRIYSPPIMFGQLLFHHGKTRGKAPLYTTFEDRRDRVHASGDTHAHGVED